MALRNAATAKSETDLKAPTDATIDDSIIISFIDSEVVKASSNYQYSLSIMFKSKTIYGVVYLMQSDSSYIEMNRVLKHLYSLGYSAQKEEYKTSAETKINIKIGWG